MLISKNSQKIKRKQIVRQMLGVFCQKTHFKLSATDKNSIIFKKDRIKRVTKS